jgi:hypothetical protein
LSGWVRIQDDGGWMLLIKMDFGRGAIPEDGILPARVSINRLFQRLSPEQTLSADFADFRRWKI